MKFDLHHGDCLEVLRTLPDNSVDSIVTDPPYGLSFMGKKWDYDVPGVDVWAECLRVLKPGGHLLAFAGTRTHHRMAVRIEDAGFEIRDMIAWVYGSGFPKSHDFAGFRDDDGMRQVKPEFVGHDQSEGWGTAIKPSLEPVTVARKPLIGTVAENVLEHGTGGLNIDGCRVGVDPIADASQLRTMQRNTRDSDDGWGMSTVQGDTPQVVRPDGRWPANLIHDGSDEVVGLFPTNAGAAAPVRKGFDGASQGIYGDYASKGDDGATFYGDKGSAARFFYCAKASKRDRDEGLEGFEAKATAFGNQAQAELKRGNLDHDDGKSGMNKVKMRQNSHPTVKPTDLMRYLCRLVTPPSGVVLDPFMGSGSTGKAAMLEGFRFVGIEREAEYLEIARARIEAATMPAPKAEKPAAQTPKPKPATHGQNDLFEAAA
jgi:DNA modification methylase